MKEIHNSRRSLRYLICNEGFSKRTFFREKVGKHLENVLILEKHLENI